MTQNAFAFAASAMIPIGQASTAGNLTFKSTATIVAKEGISMGAGAGAQKITTDVTGNDTAGMVAGMVASGVTAKGLNGIEAEANKLAKPKLGDVGDGGDAVLNDADGPVVKEGSIEQLSEIEYKELTRPLSEICEVRLYFKRASARSLAFAIPSSTVCCPIKIFSSSSVATFFTSAMWFVMEGTA